MDHIAQTQSLSQQTLSDIPQETLDQLILTPEAKAHYSQENEIKRLLIERETYKRMYEDQEKRIDEFTKQWDNIMSTPVEERKTTYYDNGRERISRNTVTLRDFINRTSFDYYCRNIYKRINYSKEILNLDFMKSKYTIRNEITYY
jgi:hypothetical protein